MNFLYVPSNFIEYNLLFFFVIISTTIAVVILGLSLLLSEKKNDLEKLLAYECGFDRAPSSLFVVWTISQSSGPLTTDHKSLNLSKKETLMENVAC